MAQNGANLFRVALESNDLRAAGLRILIERAHSEVELNLSWAKLESLPGWKHCVQRSRWLALSLELEKQTLQTSKLFGQLSKLIKTFQSAHCGSSDRAQAADSDRTGEVN